MGSVSMMRIHIDLYVVGAKLPYLFRQSGIGPTAECAVGSMAKSVGMTESAVGGTVKSAVGSIAKSAVGGKAKNAVRGTAKSTVGGTAEGDMCQWGTRWW